MGTLFGLQSSIVIPSKARGGKAVVYNHIGLNGGRDGGRQSREGSTLRAQEAYRCSWAAVQMREVGKTLSGSSADSDGAM